MCHANEAATKRPNIVLILCDDLGYADVGFNARHFGVETDVVTPNLDMLAERGTIFSQAYVAHPFCGPSRMALLSGRMPHCFGGQKNLPDAAKNLADYNDKGIPVSETLISTVLQQANYRTSCVGKWHLGDSKPFHPNARGFDEFFGFLGGGHQYYPSVTDKVEPKVNDYQYFLQRNGKDELSPEGAYLTDMLTDEAVSFVTENAGGQKSFFLYLAYNAPHSPLQGKTEDLQLLYPDHTPANPGNGIDYRDYEGRQNYVAMVYAVDRGVARITAALSDPNGDGDRSDSVIDDTLIVFLSDNGGKILQAGNNAPLQDDKGSTHEGGIRVPMFMHWPGHVPAGEVFEHPVLALDFYPTFAGLAKAEIPAKKQLDGKDVWDDFLAGRNAHDGETIFWLRHHGGGNEVAIRNGNLKAYRKMLGAWQVFDVANDVSESKNLAKANEEFLRKRVAEGAAWGRTHIDPQWHDTQNGLDSWISNKMPRHEATFALRGAQAAASESQERSNPKPVSTEAKPASGFRLLPLGDAATKSSNWTFNAGQSDEFAGNTVDRKKWNIDTQDFGPWSWEPQNVTQKDGSLHLQMVPKDHQRGKQTLHYTSGMARIDRTITYGYFEAKIKGCSRYPGACPSFWLYSIGPQNRHIASDGETVAYSEIDIVELQQSEYDFDTKKHFPVTRIDCNLHTTLIKDGKRVWARPNNRPDICKTHYDSPWDPRADYHVYGVENSRDWIVWYIDGKEVGRKPNLYWHLPMHVTLSLGLRYPFVGYKDGERFAVPEKTTAEGFPTTMSVDYVRVWQRPEDQAAQTSAKKLATDWTRDEYITKEKANWAKNGWQWNQSKVESNFAEVDTNKDGLASGQERQAWYAKKKAETEK